MNRRTFIKAGVAGMAGLTFTGTAKANPKWAFPAEEIIGKIEFGETGLTVSRMAMGTGSVGGNKSSNQTRLGMENFVKLARHAYEKGIRFCDMADSYGSQPFVGEAIKTLPRENIILSTKIWTFPDSQPLQEPVRATIDRCRKEIGSDYYDIILMHCMLESGWEQTRKRFMNALSKAKQDGIVKAVGVSCHNYDALAEAAISPWVDVIMARINPFQTLMDGTPEQIKSILEKARNNGKGIIGMKIFGEGKNVSDDERERSIKFAFTEGHVHCITLGLESIAQMDDAVGRIARLTKSL